jgi:hypothetical protein
MKKIKKLKLNRETFRALNCEALTHAVGGIPSAGAACPQTAFPPCQTHGGQCSGIPATCTVWTLNTCAAPCTNGTCAQCQFPF